jgi:hypothetical protein
LEQTVDDSNPNPMPVLFGDDEIIAQMMIASMQMDHEPVVQHQQIA